MKKALFSLLCTACMVFSAALYAKASDQSLDQIVAIVNDDVVTRSELNQNLALMKMQMTESHVPLPSSDVLQKHALNQLIDKKLQLQIAKQAGIQVEEADLDRAIFMVAQQNKVSVEGLYARLKQEGMSIADYRNEIHDQLLLQKLQQQEVISHVTITPEEINNFMNSKIWQRNAAKEYRIDDILLPFSDTPSTEEIAAAKIRANAILAKLNRGKNFHEAAQSESNDKHALEGGDLGWRKLPEIPSAFAEQVVSMQKNEIAGPIQTANGFHIIRLTGIRNTETDEAAPDRKQIQALLMQRKFEEAVQNWVSRLRSQAYIETKPFTA